MSRNGERTREACPDERCAPPPNMPAILRNPPGPNGEVYDEMLTVFAPLREQETRLRAMEARMARMQELVRVVREVRNRYQIDARTPLDVQVRCTANVADDFRALTPFITSLAGVGRLECGPNTARPRQSSMCARISCDCAAVSPPSAYCMRVASPRQPLVTGPATNPGKITRNG